MDHSKYSHIYYKSAPVTEPNKVVLPSRNDTLDIYTKTKYNCPLYSPRSSPDEWLLFHWACQWLCSAQWHQPMVESPGGMFGLDPLWGYTTLPLLQQTLHPATKSCTCVGFYCISEQEERQYNRMSTTHLICFAALKIKLNWSTLSIQHTVYWLYSSSILGCKNDTEHILFGKEI